MVAGRLFEGDTTAGDRARDHERTCFDAVGQDAMVGASQPLAALDLDRVRVGPLDLRSHLLEEAEQVVDLRLLGRRANDRVAVGERGGEHCVLGAHDGHDREAQLCAAEPARRTGEVVAVAVLDLRAEGAHRVDVQVHRAPPDAVAPRVADDHPAEPRQERAEEHEAGAHLGRRLEGHEEPLNVARRDLVDVLLGVVDHHADVAQGLGHDPDVLDLGHVAEPATLAGEDGSRQQLERRILRAADQHTATQGPAALDPEDLAGDRLRLELPMEWPGVSHCHYPRRRGPSR